VAAGLTVVVPQFRDLPGFEAASTGTKVPPLRYNLFTTSGIMDERDV
jgi:hypothetical protein